jgi:cyclopropane-fatty-acyl-phospholipid synthase
MSSWFDRALQRQVLGTLGSWSAGQLRVTLPDGEKVFFGKPAPGQGAEIVIHDPRFFSRVAFASDIGIGESYMAGEWSSPDLPQLIRAFIESRETINLDAQSLLRGPARLYNWARHSLRRNTRAGSEKNIHAHYDLGNDFYRLFLDETMAYSCGIFPDESCTLEQAQLNKYEMICNKLDLKPGERLLEIGSGWGGFAMYAARNRGVRVTTITISKEQFDYATRAVAEAGLSDRVEVRYCDYRDVQGRFDKVVSIEMLEAVGQEYWDSYFSKIDSVLEPRGRALVQVICVPDQRFAAYGPASDWIRKYVFPGGRLPSLYELQRSVRRVTQLETHGVEEIGLHYAPTLRLWRERFFKNIERVREARNFNDSFLRLWDFYLAACEASFATRWNRNLHIVLERPANMLFCS